MLSVEEIMESAAKAIRSNYAVRNQRIFSEIPRHQRLVAERKRQIREWLAVLRILQDSRNHSHVLARVTDHGEFTGRNLMAHGLRRRVILGGWDAIAERAQDQQQRRQLAEQASA